MLGESPIELGMKGHEARIYASLARDSTYQRLFASAFPGVAAPITTPNVAAALAAFQRSIVSFRSPFDRYRQNEETTALSESAARGMVLFFSNRKAGCINCHRGLNLDGGSKDVTTPADEVDVFTFHNTGLYNLAGLLSYPADNTGLSRFHGQAGRRGEVSRPDIAQYRGDSALHARWQHRDARRSHRPLRRGQSHRRIQLEAPASSRSR